MTPGAAQKEDAKQKVLSCAIGWYHAVTGEMARKELAWEDLSDDEKALFRRAREYLQITK